MGAAVVVMGAAVVVMGAAVVVMGAAVVVMGAAVVTGMSVVRRSNPARLTRGPPTPRLSHVIHDFDITNRTNRYMVGDVI
jgi:hypothetical protein